jgi:tripartite-type tricarboxylate transporter receptor subunit TctC
MKNTRDAQRGRSFAASQAHILILIALTFVCAPALRAAEYPNKAIQIINPFPPGAITDIVARIMSPKMSTLLGQPVLIVNKAGGGGAVGIQARRMLPQTATLSLSHLRPFSSFPSLVKAVVSR